MQAVRRRAKLKFVSKFVRVCVLIIQERWVGWTYIQQQGTRCMEAWVVGRYGGSVLRLRLRCSLQSERGESFEKGLCSHVCLGCLRSHVCVGCGARFTAAVSASAPTLAFSLSTAGAPRFAQAVCLRKAVATMSCSVMFFRLCALSSGRPTASKLQVGRGERDVFMF